MTPGMGEFMQRMNFKAAQIGMTSSCFYNPYGGSAFGYNSTNCIDLLKLGRHAYSYRYLMDVMTTRGDINVHVYGENDRDVTLHYDHQHDMDAIYAEIHSGAKNPHIIFGGKGGGWSTGEHKVFAYLGFCRTESRNILTVVSNVSSDRSVGRKYRYVATVELLDICSRIIRGENVDGMKVEHAEYAAAAFLPVETPSEMLKERPLDLIYTQDAETLFNPASITKVLMAITALDICPGNQEMYMITDDDIANDSNYWAFPGDIESIETGFYPIILSSNGSNTMAMARYCGEKILAEKKKFGLV